MVHLVAMNTCYYKVLSPTFCNRGFQYSLGLNEYTKDILKSKSGMYICKKKDIGYWLRLYHNPILCEAHICSESVLIKEGNNLKTDRFMLANPIPVREFINATNAMEIVSHNGMNLEYCDVQTPELCLKALQQNGRAIQFVKEKTPALIMEALKQNGRALEYIDDHTQTMCINAMKQNGLAIKFAKIKDNSVSIMAVHQNGMALKYIENPSPYVIKTALEQNGYALQFVKDQTDEYCSIAIAQNPVAKLYMRNA